MAANILQQPNLALQPAHQQTDTGLTSALASRFHAHMPTATLSSHAIVSLNTYTDPSRGVEGGEDGSAVQAVKDLAHRAYMRLGQRSEDQAVVFL
jgi:chitin synthase